MKESDKKYTRYYLVVTDNTTDYRKIESRLPFSEKEGEDSIRERVDKIKTITHIAKAKAKALGFK